MANLPLKFRKSGEAQIASFDWQDIATGIARETYYGAAANTGSVYDYFLSNQKFFSDPFLTAGALVDGTNAISEDFSLEFGLPQTLSGETIVNVPVAIDNNGIDACTTRVTAIFKKNSDTLLTISGDDFIVGAGAATTSHVSCMTGTMPQTVLGKGDTLNVTINVKTTTASPSGTAWLAHDPNNRTQAEFATTGHNRTDLIMHIPFKVDL